MILAATCEPGERRAALAHALGDCPDCAAYLEAAGPELDALLAEACVRDLGGPETAPLTTAESDDLFAGVVQALDAAETPVAEGATPANEAVDAPATAAMPGNVIAGPQRWRWARVATPVAALAAAAAALLVFLPGSGDEIPAGWTGEKGAPVSTAALQLMHGTFDASGQPLVGELIADGAEIPAGDIVLFRTTAGCEGGQYVVLERETGEPELLWQHLLPAGTHTLELNGLAVGLNTEDERGRLRLRLVLVPPSHAGANSASEVLQTTREPHPTGRCWAHDSVTVHVGPGRAD